MLSNCSDCMITRGVVQYEMEMSKLYEMLGKVSYLVRLHLAVEMECNAKRNHLICSQSTSSCFYVTELKFLTRSEGHFE